MRPTTKDLAKAAGVSLATVDRVLNRRPGVRKETVDAVTAAGRLAGLPEGQSRELVVSFGKFRGRTFEDVRKNEPAYLAWCIPELPARFANSCVVSHLGQHGERVSVTRAPFNTPNSD